MSVARYIEVCKLLQEAPGEAEYERLANERDAIYDRMSAQEIAAVEAHVEAMEPG